MIKKVREIIQRRIGNSQLDIVCEAIDDKMLGAALNTGKLSRETIRELYCEGERLCKELKSNADINWNNYSREVLGVVIGAAGVAVTAHSYFTNKDSSDLLHALFAFPFAAIWGFELYRSTKSHRRASNYQNAHDELSHNDDVIRQLNLSGGR